MATLRDITYDAYERLLTEPHGFDDWLMPPAVWAWRDGVPAAKVTMYTEDMGALGGVVQWFVEGLAADVVVLVMPTDTSAVESGISLVFAGGDRHAGVHVIESNLVHLDTETITTEQAQDAPLDRSAYVSALLQTMRQHAMTLEPNLQLLEDLDELGVEAHRAHMDVGAVRALHSFLVDAPDTPVDVVLYARPGSDRHRVLDERAPEHIHVAELE